MLMNNICIEELKSDIDIKYICDNLQSTFTCSWDVSQFMQAIDSSDTCCYIAKYNNVIVGFVCIKVILSQIDILNIAVDIKFRNMKIGYSLIKFVIDFANDKKLFPIMLEVNTNNLYAIKLYTKVGFTIIHTRIGYYFNKLTNNKEDAYIMIFKEEYIC